MKTKSIIFPASLILSAVFAYFAYSHLANRHKLPEGLIQANGRIEGDHVTVSGKFPGRVSRIMVQEGDAVRTGDMIAQLDDAQVRARRTQAREGVAALEARIMAEGLNLQIMNKEVPITVETAKAGEEDAEAVMAKTEAAAHQAERDAKRFQDLAEKGMVDRQKSEQTDLARTSAVKDLESARTGLKKAEKELSQAHLGWDRVRVKEKEIAALKAQLGQAKGVLAEAESNLQDLTIIAPSAGFVTIKMVNSGEVVSAGTPLIEMVDMDRLYLKVYVPEVQIGRIRLGLTARVSIDAFPDRSFPATVRFISHKAEFTPKEVQTPDERVKLVYAVKLYLDENPEHRLTPGLPADAVIRWKEDAPWVKPRL